MNNNEQEARKLSDEIAELQASIENGKNDFNQKKQEFNKRWREKLVDDWNVDNGESFGISFGYREDWVLRDYQNITNNKNAKIPDEDDYFERVKIKLYNAHKEYFKEVPRPIIQNGKIIKNAKSKSAKTIRVFDIQKGSRDANHAIKINENTERIQKNIQDFVTNNLKEADPSYPDIINTEDYDTKHIKNLEIRLDTKIKVIASADITDEKGEYEILRVSGQNLFVSYKGYLNPNDVSDEMKLDFLKDANHDILSQALDLQEIDCYRIYSQIQLEKLISKKEKELQNQMENLPLEERLKLADGAMKLRPSRFQVKMDEKQKQFEKNIDKLQTLQEVNSIAGSRAGSIAGSVPNSRKHSADLENDDLKKQFKIELGENPQNITYEEWLALKNQKQETPKKQIVKGTKQITAAQLLAGDEDQKTQENKTKKPIISSELQASIEKTKQIMAKTPQGTKVERIEYKQQPKIHGNQPQQSKKTLEERMKSSEPFNPLSILGTPSLVEKRIIRPKTAKPEQTLFERKNFMQEQSQKLRPITNPKDPRNYHSSEKNQTGVKLPEIDHKQFKEKVEELSKNAKVGSGLGLPPVFQKLKNQNAPILHRDETNSHHFNAALRQIKPAKPQRNGFVGGKFVNNGRV